MLHNILTMRRFYCPEKLVSIIITKAKLSKAMLFNCLRPCLVSDALEVRSVSTRDDHRVHVGPQPRHPLGGLQVGGEGEAGGQDDHPLAILNTKHCNSQMPKQ